MCWIFVIITAHLPCRSSCLQRVVLMNTFMTHVCMLSCMHACVRALMSTTCCTQAYIQSQQRATEVCACRVRRKLARTARGRAQAASCMA